MWILIICIKIIRRSFRAIPGGRSREPLLLSEPCDAESGVDQRWSELVLYECGGQSVHRMAGASGKKYYLEADGHMITGWKTLDGGWRYFDASGEQATGWRAVDGSWYFMADNDRADRLAGDGRQEILSERIRCDAGGLAEPGRKLVLL